jgi:hypothetical protein
MTEKILCRAPFPYTGIHFCPNLICYCSDFRFRQAVEKLERVLGIQGKTDGIQIPGSIKSLNDESGEGTVSGWFQVLHKLHRAKNIFIIAHAANCGAYVESGTCFGSEKEEQSVHEGELWKARGLIEGIIPGAKVRMIYACLSKNRRQVEFVEFP